MPSVTIKLHDGDMAYEVNLASESTQHGPRIIEGRSVDDLLADAVRKIERAASIAPRLTHYAGRIEIDGETIGDSARAEIESSIYDSVLRITT